MGWLYSFIHSQHSKDQSVAVEMHFPKVKRTTIVNGQHSVYSGPKNNLL